MNIYLDASVIVPLLTPEPATPRIAALLRDGHTILLSDFVVAEAAAALSRLVRANGLDADVAHRRLDAFDRWRSDVSTPVVTNGDDVVDATTLVRRFDLMLRAPDALHLALARRAKAAMTTLDRRLARAAIAVGLELAPIPA